MWPTVYLQGQGRLTLSPDDWLAKVLWDVIRLGHSLGLSASAGVPGCFVVVVVVIAQQSNRLCPIVRYQG